MSAPSMVYTFEYELSDFNTGEKLDSNVGQEPLSIVTGSGSIIKGLEEKLVDLKEGDEKKIVVKPEDGYGVYNEGMIEQHSADQFKDIELSKGMVLYGSTEDGQTVQVSVKDFDDDNVMIDFNHPLAGKTLVFDLKVLGLREASEDEATNGMIQSNDSCCGSGCGCN
ncbi:MAG: peptidylprolyl isomerase [Campylobacterales bacterium]